MWNWTYCLHTTLLMERWEKLNRVEPEVKGGHIFKHRTWNTYTQLFCSPLNCCIYQHHFDRNTPFSVIWGHIWCMCVHDQWELRLAADKLPLCCVQQITLITLGSWEILAWTWTWRPIAEQCCTFRLNSWHSFQSDLNVVAYGHLNDITEAAGGILCGIISLFISLFFKFEDMAPIIFCRTELDIKDV